MLLQVLHTFHGLRATVLRSAPSCPFQVAFSDAAGFTSDVTACGFASHAPRMLFVGLQPMDFAMNCLLATGPLGLYPG